MSDDRVARAALTRHLHPGGHIDILHEIQRSSPYAVLSRHCASKGLNLDQVMTKAAADIAFVESIGGRLVCPGDEEWPSGMHDLRSPGEQRKAVPRDPYALWVRGEGHLGQLGERAIAVVGSRDATDAGAYIASEFGYTFVEHGWCVVSGAALGIDGHAHRGALRAGGPTIAFLANGVDQAYPPAHDSLLTLILRKGCVVSEEAPGESPRRERFLARNRLIAAIGAVTVVIEAGLRSGALSTAHHAQRLLRDVLVVPGDALAPQSRGSNELLRTGFARVVITAQHVLEELGPLEPLQLTLAPVTPRDELPQQARELLEVFPSRAAIDPPALAERSGFSVAAVNRELRTLLETGFVEIADGGFALTDVARVRNGGAPS